MARPPHGRASELAGALRCARTLACASKGTGVRRQRGTATRSLAACFHGWERLGGDEDDDNEGFEGEGEERGCCTKPTYLCNVPVGVRLVCWLVNSGTVRRY